LIQFSIIFLENVAVDWVALVLRVWEVSNSKPAYWLAVRAEVFPGILQFLGQIPG
jgi:hypothetical protein